MVNLFYVKSKVIIAPTNTKAIDAIKKMQEKKRKLQKMMAEDKPIRSLLSRS
jgi:hypothetical protein